MAVCRYCSKTLIPCTQNRHNCMDGMVHATDLKHECGWLDYLLRIGWNFAKKEVGPTGETNGADRAARPAHT